MASNPIFCVDAFTDRPFRGNPAAVVLLTGEAREPWMRALAAELNLSETAFLVARGESRYGIRWFTPTCEIDLCGHATLAAAHVLYERARVPDDRPIAFEGRVHELAAVRSG
ncbi:MAG: PhzF family phenazine biosynthesis protein, partial [Nitrospinae bacterium]|nr:PhzF family phenazine biosynthesis protein [Nitrospinota bacterium]